MKMFYYAFTSIDTDWEYISTVSSYLEGKNGNTYNYIKVCLENSLTFAKRKDWDGTFQQEPRIFFVPGSNNSYSFDAGFVWKQSSNGLTIVISPEKMPWLIEYYGAEELEFNTANPCEITRSPELDKIENRFNAVKNKIDFIEYLSTGSYKVEKKSGPYHQGICLFCGKNNFTVSDTKQIFFCFDCTSGGDIISYVGKALDKTPLEAVDVLELYIANKNNAVL